MNHDKNPIIIALNFENRKDALLMVEKLLPYTKRFKIGLPLYLKYGEKIVEEIVSMGASVFLDLKLHDIPSVVTASIKNLRELKIEFLTVHAQGGSRLLKEAQKAAANHVKLLGVTILTSIEEKEYNSMCKKSIEESVIYLAGISCREGLYGVVSSGMEVHTIKEHFPSLKTIIPGIRLERENSHDQARVLSPQKALNMGADFLVVGRDITHDRNPVSRIKRYLEAIHLL